MHFQKKEINNNSIAVYVDALASCNDLTFVMAASAASGTTTIPTRSWQIKVNQDLIDQGAGSRLIVKKHKP